MSIRQTRTGSSPGSGPEHDSEPEELGVERGGKKVKVKFDAAKLNPLGDPNRPAKPPAERERKPEV